LSCLVELKTSNHSTPTWTGGANYSTIAFHGIPIEPKSTTVLSTLRNGHLDIIFELRKVYPVPKCQVLFNEEKVTNRVKTHVGMNEMFYFMNETLHHFLSHGVCTGHVTLSCNMGVKHFSVYKKMLNTCTGVPVTTKEEKSVCSESVVVDGTIACVLLFLFCIVALVAISKYRNIKDVICCNVTWKGETITAIVPIATQKRLRHGSGMNTNDGEINVERNVHIIDPLLETCL
ncbi:hypothetical protein AM593_04380, partial [Mytilus galloprovincialis]